MLWAAGGAWRSRLAGQGHHMLDPGLHPLGRDAPFGLVQVDLAAPSGLAQFLARPGEDHGQQAQIRSAMASRSGASIAATSMLPITGKA